MIPILLGIFNLWSFSKSCDRRSRTAGGDDKAMSDSNCVGQIYVTLRDERREAAIVIAEKKRAEVD